MSGPNRCHCQSCMIRGLTIPAFVIALGVLFLLHQVRGGVFDLEHTWPVLLLVVGILQLGSAMASHEGHVDVVAAAPPAPPAVPPSTPQAPYGTQGS